MKVLICWSNIAGYTAACWRALDAVEGVEVEAIAFKPAASSLSKFDPANVLGPLKCTLLDQGRPDRHAIETVISRTNPDLVLTAGWLFKPYRDVLLQARFAHLPVVMGLDLPWLGTLRQRLAPFALWRWLKRVNSAFVCGERAWQYARRLGFGEAAIDRGLYGVDATRLGAALERREAVPGGWPRSFAFAGRYIDIKGLPDLLEAYAVYRQRVERPWPLRCCGAGDYAASLAAAKGVEDLGFLQPDDLLRFLAESGVYVMPSRYDPWPLALVEASAAGLPVIATEACGSAVENVRPRFNGWLCPTADPGRLADALCEAHHAHDELHVMGRRGKAIASAYSSEMWAQRFLRIANRLGCTPAVIAVRSKSDEADMS